MFFKLSRRGVLGWTALAVLTGRARAGEPTDSLAILDAAAARIIPSDDGPGAREAKVGRYIQRQLDGDLRHLRSAFDSLAMLLDLWSQKSLGRPFVALAPEEQDRVLDQLARAQIP